VPIVGPIVGAAVDAINSKIRSAKHNANVDPAASAEINAKFGIKELTVENLDRYRWKINHAYEEMNRGITAYNNSEVQGCDEFYQIALLYQQVQRRNGKLIDEMEKFKAVFRHVESWMKELERNHLNQAESIMKSVSKQVADEISSMSNLNPAIPFQATRMESITKRHIGCTQWCCMKEKAKYNPNANWGTMKTYAGQVANFLTPIAIASVAVRQVDYTHNADNSNLRN
jgi:hypothetical protein